MRKKICALTRGRHPQRDQTYTRIARFVSRPRQETQIDAVESVADLLCDERPRTCRRRQTLPEHVQGDDIVIRSRSTDLPRDPTTCRQGAGPDRRRRSRSQPGHVRIDGMMM